MRSATVFALLVVVKRRTAKGSRDAPAVKKENVALGAISESRVQTLKERCRAVLSGEVHTVFKFLVQGNRSRSIKVLGAGRNYSSETVVSGDRSDWRGALERFHSMQRQGIVLDSTAYNALIGTCAKCSEPDRALEVLQAMHKQGMAPSNCTYKGLLNVCSEGKRIDHALEVFEAMRQQGMVADEITRDSLITACMKANRAGRALEVIQKLLQQRVVPNLVIYNALISGAASGEHPERSLELFKTMSAQGVVPDVVTYKALVSSCTRMNKTDLAKQFFAEMRQRDMVPEDTTYVGMIATDVDQSIRNQTAAEAESRNQVLRAGDQGGWTRRIAGEPVVSSGDSALSSPVTPDVLTSMSTLGSLALIVGLVLAVVIGLLVAIFLYPEPLAR